MIEKKRLHLLTWILIIFFLSACVQQNNEKGKEENMNDVNNEKTMEEKENNEVKIKMEKEEREIQPEEYPQLNEEVGVDEVEAVILTNKGEIRVKLFPTYAPLAVENFIALGEAGYYDGVTFHRVIENFMIQGGDPTGTGRGGKSAFGEPFADEFTTALAHFPGALSMANPGIPDANGSQFFIVQHQNENVNIGEKISEEYFQYMDYMEGLRWPEKTMEIYMSLGGTPHLDFRHTVFGQVIAGMDVVDEIAKVDVDNNDRPLDDVIIKTIQIVD